MRKQGQHFLRARLAAVVSASVEREAPRLSVPVYCTILYYTILYCTITIPIIYYTIRGCSAFAPFERKIGDVPRSAISGGGRPWSGCRKLGPAGRTFCFSARTTHDVRRFGIGFHLTGKVKWADESLKWHSPFRSEACEHIVKCHGTMCRGEIFKQTCNTSPPQGVRRQRGGAPARARARRAPAPRNHRPPRAALTV